MSILAGPKKFVIAEDDAHDFDSRVHEDDRERAHQIAKELSVKAFREMKFPKPIKSYSIYDTDGALIATYYRGELAG